MGDKCRRLVTASNFSLILRDKDYVNENGGIQNGFYRIIFYLIELEMTLGNQMSE